MYDSHASHSGATASAEPRGDLQWIFDSLVATSNEATGEDRRVLLSEIVCSGATRSKRLSLAWLAEGGKGTDSPAKISALAPSHLSERLGPSAIRSKLPARFVEEALDGCRTIIGSDIETDAYHRDWYKTLTGEDRFSFAAIPFELTQEKSGIFVAYSASMRALSAEDINFLDRCVGSFQMAWRLTDSRQSLRQEEEYHRQTLARLSSVLEQSLETLSEALVSRDPYTVGHEKNVAIIARRIALEAGVGEERAHLIYLSALVHDIGKIKVPLELLTKPNKLRPEEFAIIKQHAQSSYDILSKIDWPGPLADIVGQHHEKIDGSGYPRGLKGDEILPEARIITIADVLESVMARRPYREGLGVAAALKIINAGRGTSFDTAFVDIVNRLCESEPQWLSHVS